MHQDILQYDKQKNSYGDIAYLEQHMKSINDRANVLKQECDNVINLNESTKSNFSKSLTETQNTLKEITELRNKLVKPFNKHYENNQKLNHKSPGSLFFWAFYTLFNSVGRFATI